MENADAVLKPVKDFSKNSIRLVKRCTKPDRKGKPRLMMFGTALLVGRMVAPFPADVGLLMAYNVAVATAWAGSDALCSSSLADGLLKLTLPILFCRRVQQSLLPDSYWIYSHGLHRVLCEAYIHRK